MDTPEALHPDARPPYDVRDLVEQGVDMAAACMQWVQEYERRNHAIAQIAEMAPAWWDEGVDRIGGDVGL